MTNKNTKMILAVDHGNSHIKTINCAFPSAIKDSKTKLPMVTDDLLYSGTHYTLTQDRVSYMRDKTEDNRYFVLTLFAMAKELELTGQYEEGMDIILSVGLPPEHYARQQKRFAKYFLSQGKDINYLYNGKRYHFNIASVPVFPQAYAAICSQPKMLRLYPRVYVIDIGGYTIDVLLIVDGKPDLTICRSLDMGIITMINDIRTHINTNYELPIKEEHVLDVLMGKKTVLSAAVKREIVNKADAHAQAIISQLRELGIDLRVDAGIFIGGGSQLLKPYFDGSKALSAVEYIPNVNANAQGYETLARLSLRA